MTGLPAPLPPDLQLEQLLNAPLRPSVPRPAWCGCGAPADRPGGSCEACRPALRAQTRRGYLAPVYESIPARFHWARFDAPELGARCRPEDIATVQAWDGLASVALVGPTGAGKTTLAVAMVQRLLDPLLSQLKPAVDAWERGRRVRFCKCSDLGRALDSHPLGKGKPALLQAAEEASILILDDLGREGDRHRKVIIDLVFERHDRAATTLVTLSRELLGRLTAVYQDDAFERRLLEEAVLIEVDRVRRAA
jgi:DNA replication protein DnaC